MDCTHGAAKLTETTDIYWCPECGETINLNEVSEAAPAAPTKSDSDRSLPVGDVPERVGSGGSKRRARPVLPATASTSVAATAERETTKDVPQAQETGVVKDFTSADPDMPTGPWHGIPCPNRAHAEHPCSGIMETYRVIASEKVGNAYWMRCPLDSVHVILSFQTASARQ